MHTGVVEGFYGKPWSHRDRLDMIRFLGENGFNMYVYAPKDDSHIRSRWRGTYPRSYTEGIRQLSQAAARSSVDFVFTLSPGLDFVYSEAGDRRLLLDRLRPDRASQRGPGGQPQSHNGLSGQPRNGLSQRLGGADRSRCPRPLDRALAERD